MEIGEKVSRCPTGMSLSRQSITLALTTKQEPNNTQKHKQTDPSYKNGHTQKETMLKPTGVISPVRTAYTSVHITGYNCDTQYNTEQF